MTRNRPVPRAFGDRLREIRGDPTVRDFAERIGIDPSEWNGGNVLTLTKPAGVAFQIIGGIFVIGALARLLSGLSFGAVVALALGLWFMWEGRRPATMERDARAKAQEIIDRVRR
jgi:hypothetical protein